MPLSGVVSTAFVGEDCCLSLVEWFSPEREMRG